MSIKNLYGKRAEDIAEFLTDWAIENLGDIPTNDQLDIEKVYFGLQRWLIKCGEPGRIIENRYKRGTHEYAPPKRSTKYCDSDLSVILSKLEVVEWWICTEYLKATAPKQAESTNKSFEVKQLEVA